MRILHFTLYGKTAIFKKNEVNSYYYFTYGHIHKPALLGILGAVLGYGGYQNMTQKDDYPEYYEKLQSLKVSICPNAPKGVFSRKIISFNNSVGYASKEKGGNLIVKEQWLENPSWDIYVMLDCPEAEKLAETLERKECVYIPYLGKNDHVANITSVWVKDAKVVKEYSHLDCLFPAKEVELPAFIMQKPFKYEEHLPIALGLEFNQYITEKFMYTNLSIESCTKEVWGVEGQNLIFY